MNPADNGVLVTWRMFGGASTTEATNDYGKPNALVCGAPTPTNIYRPTGAISTTEGGSTLLGIEQKYSDGSWVAITPAAWSTVGAPSGISISSTGLFTVAANSLSSNLAIEVHASIVVGNDEEFIYPFTHQAINTDCQRPGSLDTYILAWNFTPPGGNARTFDTMLDAGNTVGAVLDHTIQGSLGSPFGVNITALTVGGTVYYGTDLSCALAGDNIYYVFANGQVNTIKKAITVVNGIITAIQDSTYQGCTSSPMLTPEQQEAMPSKFFIEYADPNTPNGGLPYTSRAFASRNEALQLIPAINNQTRLVNYDQNNVTTANVAIGDVMYNSNRPEHVLAAVNLYYPVEAGYWGYQFNAPSSGVPGSYILLKTNACGQIIGRETITLPAL